MRKHVLDRPNGISLSTRALSFLDGLMIGTCYGLATILGVVSAQRTTAPNFSIPEKVVLGLFIGIALWAALSGFSVSTVYTSKHRPTKGRVGFSWIAISFITSTVIPLLYFFFQNGHTLIIPWIRYFKLLLFSSLSFGLGGAIIGLSAVLLHHFYWRFLKGLQWGISLACALSIFVGLSAGWAAYGWTVFSSEALFGLNLLA